MLHFLCFSFLFRFSVTGLCGLINKQYVISILFTCEAYENDMVCIWEVRGIEVG